MNGFECELMRNPILRLDVWVSDVVCTLFVPSPFISQDECLETDIDSVNVPLLFFNVKDEVVLANKPSEFRLNKQYSLRRREDGE